MSNIKLCAFADEADASIDLQIDALKRNAIPYDPDTIVLLPTGIQFYRHVQMVRLQLRKLSVP